MDHAETASIRLCKKQSVTHLNFTANHSHSILLNASLSSMDLSSKSNSSISCTTSRLDSCLRNNSFPLKGVNVTIVLTESCASVLDLDLPKIESSEESSAASSMTTVYENRPPLVYDNRASTSAKRVNILHDSHELFPEIAYLRDVDLDESTCSVVGLDDLSQRSFKQAHTFTDGIEAFRPFVVFFPPLTVVRTIAHHNNLETDDRKIYVTVMRSETTVSESGWVNVCRICYGGESLEKLVGPCRCRGSVALAHHSCLERWLRESSRSRCELCRHRYHILREPKYSIPTSVFVWLFCPGDHTNELIKDIFGFCIYTPTALMSTYLLLLSCETVRQTLQIRKSIAANLMAIVAISVGSIGMAAIDFAYSSWLMIRIRKHMQAWRRWWISNCHFTLILPKQKRHLVS